VTDVPAALKDDHMKDQLAAGPSRIDADGGAVSRDIARFEDDGGGGSSDSRERSQPEVARQDPTAAIPGWSHDDTLGRAGELRGHAEVPPPGTASLAAESMVLDVRSVVTPRQAVQQKCEALLAAISRAAARLASRGRARRNRAAPRPRSGMG
jgi:hypothetical protein